MKKQSPRFQAAFSFFFLFFFFFSSFSFAAWVFFAFSFERTKWELIAQKREKRTSWQTAGICRLFSCETPCFRFPANTLTFLLFFLLWERNIEYWLFFSSPPSFRFPFSVAALVSRQFVDMTRIRIEGLLAAFPKLVNSGKQHTYVETENVRYVYQPMEVRWIQELFFVFFFLFRLSRLVSPGGQCVNQRNVFSFPQDRTWWLKLLLFPRSLSLSLPLSLPICVVGLLRLCTWC